jgi:hypothetical protein
MSYLIVHGRKVLRHCNSWGQKVVTPFNFIEIKEGFLSQHNFFFGLTIILVAQTPKNRESIFKKTFYLETNRI